MSKGTRQKLGIIAALLHDPPVLILDEPTSGLDPLMQQAFIDLMREERSRGKTIFLSSHIFSEIERICDRVAILKAGKIIATESILHLRASQESLFDVTLSSPPTGNILADLRVIEQRGLTWTIAVQSDYATFFKTLATLPVVHLQQRSQNLETLFAHLYVDEVHSL
jgi:ABC-2 type transport system ATP-binding protein